MLLLLPQNQMRWSAFLDRNLQEVKEKLVHVDAAFLKLKEAHYDIANEIHDADGVVQCQLYLDKEEKKFSIFR